MHLARRLLPWVLGLVLLLLAGLAAALWLTVERQPLLHEATVVSHEDIARARALLRGNDPRRALPGVTRSLVLSQRDLELLIAQSSPRLREARSRVRLQAGLALVQLSLRLPANPWGGWLNLQAVLRETDGLPAVQRLRVGHLRLPGWLAEAALPRLLAALDLRAQGALARQMVSRVAFRSQRLVLAYAWPDNATLALSQSMLGAEDQARLQVYADRLATVGAQAAAVGSAVSVATVLPPLFALAAQRSGDAASAALENRAAMVALAFSAYGPGLSSLLGTPQPALPPLGTRLAGRADTALHFLISAALAVERGGPLADAIGLYKEIADSRGGSGFSFHDLAADRAGTRLGQHAVRDPLALQARLAAGVQEADLLPAIADLPEGLAEAEYRRRFGGVDSPAYRRLLDDIDARLDRLPLLAR